MTLLQWLAFFSCFAAVFLAVYMLLERRNSARVRIRTYLVQSGQEVVVEEEIPPFRERVWRPFLRMVGVLTGRMTPTGFEQKMERTLQLAGRPFGMSVREFIGWWSVLVGLGFLSGLMLAVKMPNKRLGLMVWLTSTVITVLVPRMTLQRKTKERQKEVKQALPDTLDLLTVSVEAGLGFDQALAKVVEKTQGALAEEFKATLQEVQVGKSRRDALKDLGDRSGVESMVNFVNALIQADKLGVGIGNVLRVQAEDMRSRRRQEAEEQGMKAPIKMLFPLVFFIFPSLFVIILGPAVIQLIEMFTS